MTNPSIIVLSCLLFIVFGCSENEPTVPPGGEPPGWTYDNGAAFYAEETSDGGYIIFGNSGWVYEITFSDILLIKTDGSGNVQWRKRFGTQDVDEKVLTGRQTRDGGYIIFGLVDSSWDERGSNMWLIKTDDKGNIEWDILSANDSIADFWGPLQLVNGHFLMQHVFYTNSAKDQYETRIFEVDENGTLRWMRKLDFPFSTGLSDVYELNDSEILCVGTNAERGEKVVWIAKISKSGDVLWQKIYDVPEMGSLSYGSLTPDGGYIIGGYKYYYQNGFMVRFNGAGDTLWTRTLDADGIRNSSEWENIYHVIPMRNGFIFAGKSTTYGMDTAASGGWIGALDENGNTLWNRLIKEGFCFSVSPTRDGNYIVAGRMYEKMWLLKISPEGNILN